jgi:AcrR family transcriptional regulator
MLAELVREAVAGHSPVDDDPTRERILDAALAEGALAGVDRLTVEDVVRRSGLGRMTVYRRFAKRDDLVRALVLRETERFLDAVAAGIERAPDRRAGVAEGFVAAVAFVREHPLLSRVPVAAPGSVLELDPEVLAMGRGFIAAAIHGEARGAPSRAERWVADALARLFLTYIAIPPDDPDPASDAQLRRFATEVVTPMIERVAPS